MKKLDKRGFTMVELLATIVIIGILGTIGVVGVTKSMKSAKDRYYVAQNKLFISAAQTYFTDNKSRLPMKSGTFKQVTLETLTNSNYIEKMVDYNKSEYNKDSYVTVTKLGLNMYSYEGNLIDSEGKVQGYKESGKSTASVTFTVDNQNFSSNSPTKYTNGSKIVNINIEDTDGIAGYIISVQKRGKTVNEMDYIEAGGISKTSNKLKISPDKYGDGEYSVKVKVYDKYNDQKSSTSGKIVVDTIAPKCSINLDGVVGENGWYKERTVNVKLTIDELNRDKFDFSSKALTQPSYQTKDKNEEVITKGQSDTGDITYYAYVLDKAGNKGECKSATFKVDTKKPTCSVAVSKNPDGDNGWYVSDVAINMTSAEDSGSSLAGKGMGTVQSSPNYNGTTSTVQGNTSGVTWYGYVKDYAGNVNTCQTSTQVKVDTIVPKLVYLNYPKNATWINNTAAESDRRITTQFEVGPSGIHYMNRYHWDFQYMNIYESFSPNKYELMGVITGGWTNLGNNKYQYVSNPWSAERTTYVAYQVVNNAGKESQVTNPEINDYAQIQIDNTDPDVTIRKSGKTTIFFECSDNENHIEKFSHSKYGDDGESATNCTSDAEQCYSHTYTTASSKSPSLTCTDAAGNSATVSKSYTCKNVTKTTTKSETVTKIYTSNSINYTGWSNWNYCSSSNCSGRGNGHRVSDTKEACIAVYQGGGTCHNKPVSNIGSGTGIANTECVCRTRQKKKSTQYYKKNITNTYSVSEKQLNCS